MRAIESAAIESGQVTGLELMERAGAGVVEAVFEEWPELSEGAHRAVVLCGPGNNGGDGFVVARLLKERGWDVEVFFYGDPGKLSLDARTNYERWENLGTVTSLADDNFLDGLNALYAAHFKTQIVFDALFGIGLTRDTPHLIEDLAQDFPDTLSPDGGSIPIVAVDIPSGLCSDAGAERGAALKADLTVTFHAAKRGHALGVGPETCGKVVIKDIGLDD
ncbi:MAG: NAD(P)H-hydrate epimerase [Tateyamaria sp.]